VIVVCYELQQFSYHRYVSWYYAKETVQNIWNRTIQGYLVQTFTENPKENVVHILSCIHPGYPCKEGRRHTPTRIPL
jgi:hypothetical protein